MSGEMKLKRDKMEIKIPDKLKREGIRFVLLERSGKKPFQEKWQLKNIKFDDKELLVHLKNGGNYGVMGGGENKLLIVDFDSKVTQRELANKMPETFTVKTGSGMLHKYFFSDNSKSFKIFDSEMMTALDVQGEGKQVVGPGSIHPNGNTYQIVDDRKIAFIPYAELRALILPLDRKPKKKQKEWEKPENYRHDNFLDEVKSQVSIEKVLSDFGIDVSKNPTNCPFHDSKGGKCLGWEREVAHCFHCEGAWNIFSLVMAYNKCIFVEALEWICSHYGLEEELKQSRKNYAKGLENEVEQEEEILRQKYIDHISGKEKEWGAASELLVKYLKDKHHIYTTKSDLKPEIWMYKEGIYVENGKCEIKENLRRILKQNFSEYISNMVLAKIQADTSIDADKFFNNNYIHLVPVNNGILNIFTGELRSYDPEFIFFNKVPVKYDVLATCPKIESFFKSVLLAEDDINVLYEILGFALLSEYRFEKAFMFVGDGRNGKGKTIDLMKRFIGAENCASIPLSQLDPESFSISELFKKRLNLAGDIGYQSLKETSTFKGLTGRDLIGGKRKFLPNIYFENYAKMIFACNELPMVFDTSRGFWDRWVLLEFPFTFVSKKECDNFPNDKKLKVRIENILETLTTEEEMSGLLNQALLGLNRLLKNKEFSATKGSSEIKSLWIRKANSFIAFATDCLIDDYDSTITKRELRKKYSEYCKEHSVPIKSDYVIKRVLNEEFGANDEYIRSEDNSIFAKQEWVWRGVRWKE